ncbi:MAG: hypothetical protein ACFCVH_07600 [Alphaproteobacteria bacterium]
MPRFVNELADSGPCVRDLARISALNDASTASGQDMQQSANDESALAGTQYDIVRTTAARLIERVGREAAVRMCRSNMWLGVLDEIERAPTR